MALWLLNPKISAIDVDYKLFRLNMETNHVDEKVRLDYKHL